MKTLTLIAATFLASLLASPIPVCAQQDDHDKPAQQEDKRDPDAKPRQDDKQVQKDEKREQHDEKVEHKVDARAGGEAHRIPDEQFRAHFGTQHRFVINHVTVVEGAPRFQYGGYWFAIAQPWPAGWLYTDNCYIDFIDGEYFLFDVVHPGVPVAINVVL